MCDWAMIMSLITCEHRLMQVSLRMFRNGVGTSHGILLGLLMNYFVMVLENQIIFVIIERRIFNYYGRVDIIFF